MYHGDRKFISGIIEAPSFHIPTVDIGDRQKGRICAESVIHCGTRTEEICGAIESAFGWKNKHQDIVTLNPYEKEGTVETMIKQIRRYLEKGHEGKKIFHDV